MIVHLVTFILEHNPIDVSTLEYTKQENKSILSLVFFNIISLL